MFKAELVTLVSLKVPSGCSFSLSLSLSFPGCRNCGKKDGRKSFSSHQETAFSFHPLFFLVRRKKNLLSLQSLISLSSRHKREKGKGRRKQERLLKKVGNCLVFCHLRRRRRREEEEEEEEVEEEKEKEEEEEGGGGGKARQGVEKTAFFYYFVCGWSSFVTTGG